jgi:tetraacyldisaccharide 4'-kinase
MLTDAKFRRLVSGQWRGPVAAGLRGFLVLGEWIYTWAIRRRNRRFDCSRDVRKMAAPVISIGNLTVGGTGKTPLVAWLARWFVQRQIAVTILSRGYGARDGRPNDEALELSARLPGVPHLQNPDRVAAAKKALQQNPRQVLILDDAFQHRRLARDLDVVLLDALEPFGYGHLLPRGLLREPVESLARAHIVALSRSDAVDDARRQAIARQVRQVAPQALWLELAHRPSRLISASGSTLDLNAVSGRAVAAFCGIGNSAGFRHTLTQCGIEVKGFLELPDHCPYDDIALTRVRQFLEALPDAKHVLCTRKDLVKIPREELAGKQLWALEIELQIIQGEEALVSLLKRLERWITNENHRDDRQRESR